MMAFVYVLAPADGPGLVKVGRSRNPRHRCSSLSRERGVKLRIASLFAASMEGEAQLVEQNTHHRLRDCRAFGEWFDVDPDQAASTIAKVILDRRRKGVLLGAFMFRVDWRDRKSLRRLLSRPSHTPNPAIIGNPWISQAAIVRPVTPLSRRSGL